MKKFDNFCLALENLNDVYNYDEPYENVVLTGLVALYEICFEQSWKAMKEILEYSGFEESATGSPRQVLKTAYKAGLKKCGLRPWQAEIMWRMLIIRLLRWIS